MKQNRRVIFFDSNSPQPQSTKQNTSNYNPPKKEPTDPLDIMDETVRVQNVIREINQMNLDELNILLLAISRIYPNRS
jgi:hypothetical protein